MKKVKLTDICTPRQWKTIPTDQLLDKGYPVYGANGLIGYLDEYNHENSVVTITCRGATCGSVNRTCPKAYITGNAMCLDDVSENISIDYLYYCMKNYDFTSVISGSAQPQITRQGLEGVQIKICTEGEQEKIVNNLEKLEKIILFRKRQLNTLDLLIKARFVEIFGDTALNPFELRSVALEGIADIVSGITKGRKTKEQNLIEVPYMAVSNVKNGYIDWTTVKTIQATDTEIKQYRLLPDDVLMTEGGDPDKVGRGAIIRKPLENCIHQNHIFRVRLNEGILLPTYFAEYLQHPKAKQYFLGCAKQTTGIASINMSQLRKLPVLVPPIDKQSDFDLFVEQVGKSKVLIQKSLDENQILFDCKSILDNK